MTDRLFAATVLPSRAVTTREGRLYVSGETVRLPESELDELEFAGFVRLTFKRAAPKSGPTRTKAQS